MIALLAVLAQDERTTMFVLNLRLIIGGMICLGTLAVIGFFVWTAIRAWRFSQQQDRIDADMKAHPHQTDRKTGAPIDRGACDRCGHIFRKLYVQADGRRICPICRKIEADIASGASPPSD